MLTTLFFTMAHAASAQAPLAQEDPSVTTFALQLYHQMRGGHIDPTLLTPEMNAEFNPETLAEEKLVFDQLGDPIATTFISAERHTKGTLYEYLVRFSAAQLHVKIFLHKDGRFAGYSVSP